MATTATAKRVAVAGGMAAVFVVLWALVHPARPHLATSDLYTHLAVTRHVVRGDGFVNDVVYPLSLAFPFATEVPQPLIHRGPGYALVLILPYLTTNGDPRGTLTGVRWLHLVALGGMVSLGVAAYLRQGDAAAIPAWLILLLSSPLLDFVVNWGQVETLCAACLLAIWLRWRRCESVGDPQTTLGSDLRAGVGDGLLIGALALLRPELIWIPVLWWWAIRLSTRRIGSDPDAPRPGPGHRRGWLALVVCVMLLLPWFTRTARVAGNPLFTLQSHGEQLKMTERWPGYTIYRSLSPQSLTETLREDPGPVLRKARHGVRFFATEIGRWLPWPLLIACVIGWILAVARAGSSRCSAVASPLALLMATGVLLAAQYTIFDHSLRHLVPLLPLFGWEMCRTGARVLGRVGRPVTADARKPGTGHRRHYGPHLALAGIVTASLLIAPLRLPGWQRSAHTAAAEAAGVERLVARAAQLAAGPVFTDNSAVLWFAERAGVWSPLDTSVEQTIRVRIPEMADAPWLRLRDE